MTTSIQQIAIGAITASVTIMQTEEATAQVAETVPERPMAGATQAGQPSSTPHYSMGLALGYGIPQGELAHGDRLSGNVAGLVPLWIDFNYHPSPPLEVGIHALFGYGFGADIDWTTDDVKTECASDTINCPTVDVRSGLHARYHVLPGNQYNPWVGVGLGVDFLIVSIEEKGGPDSQGTDLGDIQAWGYQGDLQAGLDILVTPSISLGPFVDYSLGRYEGIKVKLKGGEEDSAIDAKALHSWLIVGVKGNFLK